jgi:hypothetical protein
MDSETAPPHVANFTMMALNGLGIWALPRSVEDTR